MLAPLDNEVVFKKAFTDPLVLCSFVRDIVGVEAEFAKIETEKKFDPPLGDVNFAYDVFAESIDQRIVVELQKESYDYHFDRFLHYHNMAISQQVEKGPNYRIGRKVYTIVLLTSPYVLPHDSDEPIQDNVLISRADPTNLAGEYRNIYGHELILLNPAFPDPNLPQPYQDWFDLIRLSLEKIDQQDLSKLNLSKPGISRVTEIIDRDELTPEEREQMKIENQKRQTREILQSRIKTAETNQAQAEQEKARVEQEKARVEQEKAQVEREKAQAEQEKARVEQEKARVEREKAQAEREKAQAEQEKVRAEQEKVRAEQEKVRAEQEKARVEQEKARVEQEKAQAESDRDTYADKLRQLGLDPDNL